MGTGLRRDGAGDLPILEAASPQPFESGLPALVAKAIVKDIDLTPSTYCIRHSPAWDGVTADPRYAALLKRHGLDP